ncbi:MAG: hypothetical protein KDB72_04030 [Mycobacterium sp.]|nr:hypothetical protein [Mycobacterium sp.]
MVIARTDLYVPDIGARSRRWRRIAVAQPIPATGPGVRRGALLAWAAAAFTSVFPGRGETDRPARRQHPVRRPDFVEGAALSREMFRL